FHTEFFHRIADFFCSHIERKISAHFAREIETVRIDIGNHDVARTRPLTNWNGHATNWAGASDQDIFTDQIERERSVNSVAKGIETRKHVERDRGIGMPAV